MHSTLTGAQQTIFPWGKIHLYDRVPQLSHVVVYTKQAIRAKLVEHREYITRYSQDMPEIREWQWNV